MEELDSLFPDEFDSLPFGVIELDEQSRIVEFNRHECEMSGLGRGEVIGRRFFGDVAPCTRVKEFEGRYSELASGEIQGPVEFSFVFHFRGRTRVVTVSMSYEAERQRGLILIRDHA